MTFSLQTIAAGLVVLALLEVFYVVRIEYSNHHAGYPYRRSSKLYAMMMMIFQIINYLIYAAIISYGHPMVATIFFSVQALCGAIRFFCMTAAYRGALGAIQCEASVRNARYIESFYHFVRNKF